MSWIEDLAAYGDAQFAADIAGSTLFVGKRTDDKTLPDFCTVLTEYEGGMLEHFGTSNDVEMPNLQMSFRGDPDDYAGPRDRAWAYHRYFRRIINQTIGATFFYIVHPLSTPNPQGQDSQQRYQFLVDFSVSVREP